MKLKITFLFIILFIFLSFFFDLFHINKSSKLYIQLKKNFTGIYHYIGFYNFKSQPEKNISLNLIKPEIIFANNFDLEITQLKNYNFSGRSSALFINDQNEISLFHQEGYVIKNNSIEKLNLSDSFTLEKHGGLKGVFKINNDYFGLISSRTINCYKSSIVSFSKNKEIFTTECLPADNLIDYNGLGGANFINKNNLYLSIGTPEMYSQKIRALSQDDKSFYGKIVQVNLQEFEKKNISNVEVFSKGHRNPQGIVDYNSLILSTEHGPWGGDEINIIKKNKNYGWPIVSYGTKYSKNDIEGAEIGESFEFNHNSKSFEEPLYTFIPSEAISDLSKCPTSLINYYKKPCLLLTSLKSASLFIILLDENMNRILSIEKIIIGMRLRNFAKNENNSHYEGNDHIYVSADQEGVIKIKFLNFR